MKITFLGTGSIIPDVGTGKGRRSYSSILVEMGRTKLLFDIGPGTLTKMQSLAIDTQKYPDYLFITHFHIDHCLDYLALVKSRHFDKKTCQVGKGKIIHVFGPRGLIRWNKEIFQNVRMWNYMSKELDYREVTKCNEIKDGFVFGKNNYKVSCCPIDHYGGVAYRLDVKDKSFVYSGDMTYDERICKLGQNADMVAIECSFPNKELLSGKHLEPSLIGKLAKKGNFKNIILTHMYPLAHGKEKEIKKTIKDIAGCNVLVAYDFKELTL